MDISNAELAKILKNVAASYTIRKIGNFFQIRAYEVAADSIEHSTVEIFDLWKEGKMDSIPGLGEAIRGYLDELFKTGQVKHFEDVQKGIPKLVFKLLDIPGVGPKTAEKIVRLGVKDLDDLKKRLKSGELVEKGFSAKIGEKILVGLDSLNQKGSRMLLPYAFAQAEKIIQYLKNCPQVIEVNPLGSLRRMVATIGDLDFAVSSKNPKVVADYFCKMPYAARILDQGDNKASVILKTGIRTDLLVGEPSSYGALLQHFTGSKNHNIHLRTLAQEKGLSLSEYGVKKLKTQMSKIKTTTQSSKLNTDIKTEKELYALLGMEVPPPEIREDTGEIEAALRSAQGKLDGLPKLVETKDIKGDLHLHSSFPLLKPSHAPGVDSIEEIVKHAQSLGYEYIGISDHSPSPSLSQQEILNTLKKRTKYIQSINKSTKSIRVLNGLEIDILSGGSLSVPDEILQTLDYCIAGIHSGHSDSKEAITKRLISALSNPYVDIISHPTGRLLNERNSSDADWEEVFKVAAKNKKILEINSHPIRLDLRDDLVRLAKKFEVKFIINTDAHEVTQMDNMFYGVTVARRGWAEAKDIINTWDWKKFSEWFKLQL